MNTKIKLILALIFLSTVSFAQIADTVTYKPVELPAGFTSQMNVVYSTAPNWEGKMDIYLPPKDKGASPVVINIHGGGWNKGVRESQTGFNTFFKMGFAVANISFRLTGHTTAPAAVEDARCALIYLIKHAKDLSMDVNKIVVMGGSAGGHLALLQGYKYTIPVKPKAIIDFFGPTDLVDFYNNPPTPAVPLLLTSVIGGSPATHNTMYVQSSPVTFITAQSPPTLILYGGADIIVSPSQSTLLNTRLQTAGVIRQLAFYPTEGHGWTGANLTDSFNKIQAFLAANVN